MIQEKTTRVDWQQFMWRCPQCRQVWLIFAAGEAAAQRCKSCGAGLLLPAGKPIPAAPPPSREPRHKSP